jgi:AcrR family transcriptional regulator
MTPALKTSELLLERAIEAIERGGEAAIRVRDLAAECGVTTPIVYRHFGSREGLVVKAQATRYLRSHFEVFELFDPSTMAATSREELRAVFHAFVNWVLRPERAQFRRMRASVIGSAVSRPELAEAIRDADVQFVRHLVALFSPIQQRGMIRQDLPLEAFGMWYLGQLDGRIHLELFDLPVDGDQWNEVSRRAIDWLVFGAG